MELKDAVESITIDDLYYYLLRYGHAYNTEADCKKKFPEITIDLIMEVIETADECPVCFKRFVAGNSTHLGECKLGMFFRENHDTIKTMRQVPNSYYTSR